MTLSQLSTEISSQCNMAHIRKKKHKDPKGRNKTNLFLDDIIICTENPKSTKNDPRTNA